MHQHTLGIDAAAIIGCFVVAAAVIDYREHRVPNYLTIPTAILGLLFSFLPGWIGPPFSLLGFVVGFSLLILPWILGGGGMGDVKLLAALGSWVGPLYILGIFAGATFFAAFMAIGVLVYATVSSGVTATKQNYLAVAGGASLGETPRKRKRVLPFAVPVALSTIAFLIIKLVSQA